MANWRSPVMEKRWLFVAVIVVVTAVLISLRRNLNVEDDVTGTGIGQHLPASLQQSSDGSQGRAPASADDDDDDDDDGSGEDGRLRGLQYQFYRDTCPNAELIVKSTMVEIYKESKTVTPALLRLLFHDCFIKGCDASVFLNDTTNGNSSERQAIPNRTLKGFQEIDRIKEALEIACPGVVSCADTLAVATRDGIVLAGGLYYPVFTGRRDSTESYFRRATKFIPPPALKINETIDRFSKKGFNLREIVALLGAHNIGRMGCAFVRPDPTSNAGFQDEIRNKCQDQNNFISSGTQFDAHYYQNLLNGRGLLISDQELLRNETTAQYVGEFASDDGTIFRRDFSRAMVRMSNLNVLTGSKGQVRTTCSMTVNNF